MLHLSWSEVSTLNSTIWRHNKMPSRDFTMIQMTNFRHSQIREPPNMKECKNVRHKQEKDCRIKKLRKEKECLLIPTVPNPPYSRNFQKNLTQVLSSNAEMACPQNRRGVRRCLRIPGASKRISQSEKLERASAR